MPHDWGDGSYVNVGHSSAYCRAVAGRMWIGALTSSVHRPDAGESSGQVNDLLSMFPSHQ